MSVINALGEQWSKAEFAHQLARALAPRPGVAALFGGATSLSTVCNLIAAMSYRADDARFAKEARPSSHPRLNSDTGTDTGCDASTDARSARNAHRNEGFTFTNKLLISVFHDCFRLLFIKEVQSGGLNQAEQLILVLAKMIAEDTAVESLDDGAALQRQQMIAFSAQLDALYRQRRSANRNMI